MSVQITLLRCSDPEPHNVHDWTPEPKVIHGVKRCPGVLKQPMTRAEAPRIDVLSELRDQGNARRGRWHTPDTQPWTGADWSNAMCGEAGEAANVVKKIRRIETGTGSPGGPPLEELRQMLAHELADTIAYADLLAQHYDIDLRVAVAEKFNIVSEREGFPERISIGGDR